MSVGCKHCQCVGRGEWPVAVDTCVGRLDMYLAYWIPTKWHHDGIYRQGRTDPAFSCKLTCIYLHMFPENNFPSLYCLGLTTCRNMSAYSNNLLNRCKSSFIIQIKTINFITLRRPVFVLDSTLLCTLEVAWRLVPYPTLMTGPTAEGLALFCCV